MKRILSLILTVLTALTLTIPLASCGERDEKTLRVGASTTPHAEILEAARPLLEAKGYRLEIVTYDDYILPNRALADGELDANYFQHFPYLKSYNQANGTDLVSAGAIHYEPFGLYGKGVSSVAAIPAGATIIVPADDSNETRALFLLAEQGLITLPDGATAEKGVSILDIVDRKGYNVVKAEAELVAAQLRNADEGTVAVINGNYAIGAGLKIADALATETAAGEAASLYANIVAVRPADLDSEKIRALMEVLCSAEIAAYIRDTYNGAVVSATAE